MLFQHRHYRKRDGSKKVVTVLHDGMSVWNDKIKAWQIKVKDIQSGRESFVIDMDFKNKYMAAKNKPPRNERTLASR